MSYLNELNSKILAALKRFPIALLWAILGSVCCIVILEVDPNALFETYRNATFTLILGVSWLLATKFLIESFQPPKRLWWLKIVTLTLLGLFYWSLPQYLEEDNAITIIRWFLYFLAGHIFLFFAPFVNQWNNAVYWNYLKNIFIAIGRSILFSLVLYLGLILALAAIGALFEMDIDGKRFGQIFVFCFGIVNTCIYVSDFPKNIQENTQVLYNKPLEVFIKYILIPLVILYLIILYLYSLKILILWELPKGWVSYMITTLAILGFIIQIIINPVRKTHSSLLFRKFHPWFYLCLLPMMILLFIAVFRRILDYNFTENRYFLLVLSFWILGMLLYLLLSKKKQLRVIPISLFTLILLSSFGPWGAFQVSVKAQTQEFKTIFSEINPKTNSLSEKKVNRLKNITRYLARRNKITKIAPIIGFNPELAFKDANRYNLGSKILDSLNIKMEYSEANKDRSYVFQRKDNKHIVTEIHDFTYFAELSLDQNQVNSSIYLIKEDGYLKIKKNNRVILTFNLDRELLKLIKKYDNLYNAEPEDFVFDFTNKNGNFKIIFNRIQFYVEDGKLEINYINAYLFLNIE